MRKLLPLLFSFSLICAPAASARQNRRAAAPRRPVAARFIVRLKLDDEYRSTTDKPNELGRDRPNDTGKTESRLHLEAEARRWVEIAAGDGGATEFRDLEGGEPASGSGTVSLSATSESRTDNEPGEKGRVESKMSEREGFDGRVLPTGVELSAPFFSDAGDGLVFQLKLRGQLKGSCHLTASDAHGTRNSDDCGDVTASVAEGFTKQGENHDADKSPATAYLADFAADFEIGPAPRGARAGDVAQATPDSAPGQWYGAETRGDPQSGYKITLSKTKVLKSSDQGGVSEQWTQKLTVEAEIIPGPKSALARPAPDSRPAADSQRAADSSAASAGRSFERRPESLDPRRRAFTTR